MKTINPTTTRESLELLRVILHRAEQARYSSERMGPIASEWLDGIISGARSALNKAEGGDSHR